MYRTIPRSDADSRCRLLPLVALLLVALLLPSVAMATPAEDGRFFQVVFVYVKDATRYGEYVQALGPVVSRYGVRADRIIVPDKVFPDALGQPDFVNIVSYESEAAFRRFEQDPDFLALHDLRAAAIDTKGLNARSITTADDGLSSIADRPYMVELVHYRDDDPTKFRHYRRAAEPVMRRHGFHTERRLEPVEAIGGLALPDAVAIHFFDSAEGQASAEKDPQHGEIEALYGEAIEDLVWIEGRALSR